MNAPDEKPRATPREDREAVRGVLRAHEPLPGIPRWCSCGHRADTLYGRETHVAEQIAPVVAAARAEAWDEGWDEFSGRTGAVRFLDADGNVIRPNPYRAARTAAGGGAGV